MCDYDTSSNYFEIDCLTTLDYRYNITSTTIKMIKETANKVIFAVNFVKKIV